MSESDVLSACLSYLQSRRIFCWRNNTGALKVANRFVRFGLQGSSDILGITQDGRLIAVECKREKGGKLTESQKLFLEKIKENRGIAIVVRSVSELIEKLYKEGVV